MRQSLVDGTELFELVHAHDDLGPEAAELLQPGIGRNRRNSHGGSGAVAVAAQLNNLRELVDALP